MKRDLRISAWSEKQAALPLPEPQPLFSEEDFQRVADAEANASENRFDAIKSPAAIHSALQAVADLRLNENLQVFVTNKASKIPKTSGRCRFKYSPGVLEECFDRIQNGERIFVAHVEEEGITIGYAIACEKKERSEIEIVDVDFYSRRRAGLAKSFKAAGQEFSVGVGHIAVIALIGKCRSPLWTDATSEQSRFIFKSLGFVHDETVDNPCILVRT